MRHEVLWHFEIQTDHRILARKSDQVLNNNNNNNNNHTSNINIQKQPNENEPPALKNGNPTQPNTAQPNTAQPNNPEQTLSQEQKLNLENLKRIMNSEKTTLPSLRNRIENS